MKETNTMKGKIRITPKLIALLVAGGIALTPISGVAKTDNSYDPGTFVKHVEQVEGAKYGEYIVKKGDNLSRISEKVCSHLRIDITTKYWPVLAFLNHYPRVIDEGDIIIFPKSSEQLEELSTKLQTSGWTSKYKQTYKVYGVKKPKKKLSMTAVTKILSDYYGPEVCVDPDLISLYLKTTGLDSKYYLSIDDKIDDDTYFDLTDWMPTLEELEEYKESHKPKTKKK